MRDEQVLLTSSSCLIESCSVWQAQRTWSSVTPASIMSSTAASMAAALSVQTASTRDSRRNCVFVRSLSTAAT